MFYDDWDMNDFFWQILIQEICQLNPKRSQVIEVNIEDTQNLSWNKKKHQRYKGPRSRQN